MKTTHIQIRITPELKESVRDKANEQGLSISALIYKILKKEVVRCRERKS